MAKTNTDKQTTNIAVMQTDIGYIKKAIEGIEKQLADMSNNFVKKEELKDATKDLATEMSDHETRLRFIERYMWLAIGALGVVQFAISYFK